MARQEILDALASPTGRMPHGIDPDEIQRLVDRLTPARTRSLTELVRGMAAGPCRVGLIGRLSLTPPTKDWLQRNGMARAASTSPQRWEITRLGEYVARVVMRDFYLDAVSEADRLGRAMADREAS